MIADQKVEAYDAPAQALGEALYFDSDEHRLFGWLHAASPESKGGIGLVICKPFGYEAICSHRGLRAFAETAASLGIPALRFDYSGTGDSDDLAADADQVEVWTRNVVAAVEELRRRTGVEQVCILGLRLGALLGALAAKHCEAVRSLLLIAPVITGKSYLRELRRMRLAASLGIELVERDKDAFAAAVGSFEVSGSALSAATLTTLGKVDTTLLNLSQVTDILIIDRADLPIARAWADTLAANGTRTRYLQLPGFVEMVLTAPQFAIVPQALIRASQQWLSEQYAQSTRPNVAHDIDHQRASPLVVISLPGGGLGPHSPVTEHPVFFGSEATLFGVVTAPREGERRRRAVILLNAGADHHIGANRMYVRLARHWARRGYFVLRMDLAGLGDSVTRPGRPGNEEFPPAALDDIRAATELMRSRYGARDITLAGLCSGAYHCLRAAAAALPVNRILLINPQNYFWTEGMTIKDIQVAEVISQTGLYRERMFTAKTWRKLLSGQVDVGYVARIYLQRAWMTVESAVRDLARHMHVHLPRDLGWELEEMAARGVQVTFVFSRGAPGLDLLKMQAGDSVGRLGDQCRVHVIDRADHTFSRRGAHALLERILSEELYARSPVPAAPLGAELKHG